MASLFNQQISQTYQGLLKTTGNGVLTASLAQITDGSGNGSKLYLSTSKINFYNAYEFPTTDGSANQVLKTDGNGALTWENDANTGGVQVSGTPSADQIAIWTNATTIKGMSTLTIDTNGKITITQGTQNYYIGGGNLANNNGQGNVGLGNDVFKIQTSGNFNIGIGDFAFEDFITGNRNIGIGYASISNSTGTTSNVGVGASTLSYATANNNTALGDSALGNASFTGTQNTALGYDSGKNITSGSKNVILGSNTGTSIATSSNNIIISDGDGNNRLQFNAAGAASFKNSISLEPGVSAGTSSFIGFNHSSLFAYIGSAAAILSGGAAADYVAGNTTTAANVILATNNTERVRISSAGDATFTPSGGSVVIGSSGHITSTQALDVATAGGRFIGSSNRGVLGDIRIEQTTTGVDGGYIAFRTSPSGSTTPTEHMRITSGGLATFSNGIQFGTGDTLDAYEESTYSPTLTGGSTAGSSPTGTGIYTVIGNVCHLTIRFSNVTVSGGAAGAITISLPFAGKSTASGQTTADINTYNLGFTTTSMNRMNVSGSTIYGLQSTNGGAWADWDIINSSSIYINLSLTYLIN